MNKTIAYIFISTFLFTNLQAQDTIGGVVNSYLKVDSVFTDRVKINPSYNLSDFKRGDLVLLIQMTGGTTEDTTYSNWHVNKITSHYLNNTGRYEFLSIDKIRESDHQIIFTAKLIGEFTSGERIQLIKVRESTEDLVVNEEITAPAWNGETGGVVAIFTLGNVILNSGITAAEKGFRGAQPELYYTGGVNITDTAFYLFADSNKAALKGEGAMSVIYSHPLFSRGWANVLNAGGGGHGLYSGGGGGANFGDGGSGGSQLNSYGNDYPVAVGGTGSPVISDEYIKGKSDIAIFGGGGGTSTQNISDSRFATKGGNGGGIVFIIADTLIGNNNLISAKGESVTQIATAGGGGGGAGGCVFLELNGVRTNVRVNIKGGEGGIAEGSCTGSGGGGGGGLLCHSLEAHLPANIIVDSSETNAVIVTGCIPYKGTKGAAGGVLNTLETPLNGYYFNSIQDDDTICQGQFPNLLTGSVPKGGNGDFHFVWQESTDQMTWDSVGALEDSLAYQPPPLYETKYYRRYVVAFDGTGAADTSKVLTIFVHDSIHGNIIQSPDTICYGAMAAPLTGDSIVKGGNSVYTYKWQQRTDDSDWANVSDSLTSPFPYYPGKLYDTTYIRRIVISAKVCRDTSNHTTITVLPLIENNFPVESLQTICEGDTAQVINYSNTLKGGEPLHYEYNWLESNDSLVYSLINDSTGSSFSPGILTDTKYYKRIVKSGIENACIDTSVAFKLLVLPAILNDTLYGGQHLCYGDIPEIISGSIPLNGDGISYDYNWYKSYNSDDWQLIEDQKNKDFESSNEASDTMYFYRTVESGPAGVCKSQSNTVTIEVIPEILDVDILAKTDTVCEGNNPQLFNGEAANGGNGLVLYQWQKRAETSQNWEDIDGANEQHFQEGAVTESSYYRRMVMSDVCAKSSDSVLIRVLNAITNNAIIDEPETAVCDSHAILLKGESDLSGGMEGDLRFLWLQSTNDINWDIVDATNDYANYQTPVLNNPIYYSRIVYSGLSNECIDTSNSILVTIDEQPEQPDAGDDIYLNFDFGSEIFATAPNPGNGYWRVKTGNASFDDSTSYSTFVDDLNVGTNILEWVVVNGVCDPVADTLVIKVSEKVIQGFSPNDDGINDLFNMRPPVGVQGEMIVFNEWGNIVYYHDNYGVDENFWDGKNLDGDPLPAGTYFYIFNYSNDKASRRGYVVLRR